MSHLADDQAGNLAPEQERTILVIDDEPGILRGCERVLRAEGHQVILADRAEQGLQLLRERPEIDLALVDLRMPGMDGLELLAQAGEIAQETVFVVITAYATIEAAVEATKRGAYDFLAKPFSPDELVRLVNRALERVQLMRERNRLQAERRRRMLELATEQSRLRTIINCMAEGVIVSNAEQQLVLYNPAALKVLRPSEAGTPPERVCEVVECQEMVDMIGEASEAARRVSREVKLAEHPREAWVLVDVAPVTDESSGQFLGTVTVLRDITELKRVEQVKAQFVNMVAHELRAPLAAVDGYLSVMMEGLAKDPEKQLRMVGRSKRRLKALLDLVNDLLDVARMEAGAVRREISAQDMAEIVNEAVELMQPFAADARVSLESAAAESLPAVEADREELFRLLSNLLSNAIKYNRERGRVTVTAEQDGPYVKVAVADTGVGISEEGMEKLFTEFFREKTAQTREATGTGLGLSIVKRIVDFYHGRVDVRSKLGEGSTFTVWLPSKTASRSSGDGGTGGPPAASP